MRSIVGFSITFMAETFLCRLYLRQIYILWSSVKPQILRSFSSHMVRMAFYFFNS